MKPAFIFSEAPSDKLGRHVVFWVSFVLFFTILYGNKGVSDFGWLRSFGSAMLESIAFMPIHMFLSYFIIYFLVPQYLFKGRYLGMMALLVLAMFITGSLSWIISETIVFRIKTLFKLTFWHDGYFLGLMVGLRGGVTIAGFAAAIKLMKHWYLKKQEAEKLQTLQLQSELNLLKAQIHPHFLFNTLNNIYSYSLQKNLAAPGMILNLADMLRYILYECNQPLVPLEKELELIRNYLGLEQKRYGENLDMGVNIQGDPSGKFIAPLLLLPFVENSFKHGASVMLEQPWIVLDIAVERDRLLMRLVNGIGTVDEPLKQESQGIGLLNVRQRLNLLYHDNHQLQVLAGDDSFLVNLELQLDTPETATAPFIN